MREIERNKSLVGMARKEEGSPKLLFFFVFFCQYIFYKDGQIANRS